MWMAAEQNFNEEIHILTFLISSLVSQLNDARKDVDNKNELNRFHRGFSNNKQHSVS